MTMSSQVPLHGSLQGVSSGSFTPSYSGALSVISDTICPWCFVGKRRLEMALATLGEEGLTFNVEWLPYQLNPDMPDDGLDRREYRAAKFGSLAKSEALDAQMVETGAEVGLAFRYDLIERTPNTLASHVMIADARRAGGSAMQNIAVEALFSAYFLEGQDIGRPEVLQEIAFKAGFDHGPSVDAALWELVQQEDLTARGAGITGVPSFLLDGHFLFSGAQPADVIVPALRRAVAVIAGNPDPSLIGDIL